MCRIFDRVKNYVAIMHSKIPEPVQPVLQKYLLLIEKELPGFLIGFYLHGSLALGAFNTHWSDIDFITVISRRCRTEDVERLKNIHGQLARKHPRWDLSGSYLQLEDLGQSNEAIAPAPCHHDGVLNSIGHPEAGLVTWWVLKNRGIAVVGNELSNLPFTIDWENLMTGMHQNLNTYWKDFTCKPSRMSWLLTDYGIQWAVLGVLRLYYTFCEQDITSKFGAGEYALKHLPTQWHGIIRDAISIRNQKKVTFYKLRLMRALEAIRFIKYVIQECNHNF